MKFKALSPSTILLMTLMLTSCSSPEKRTRYSDKNMRIMIDPTSLDENNFVALQTALVRSDVWSVIDRGRGFKAVKREQERLHRNEADRFSDNQKFAHWGKFYGVGSVIVGNLQCHNEASFWNRGKLIRKCRLFLNVIDANTGEVVVGVEDKEEVSFGANTETPNWDEIVEKLVEVYPKYFNPKKRTERLERYKQLSKENSQRMKERQ